MAEKLLEKPETPSPANPEVPMTLSELQSGDLIFAAAPIHNDGGIPDLAEDALIAAPGTRGMLVNIGHLEEDPEQTIYLVRFEDAEGELGPPVGCLPEELSAGPVG
jgi:nitrogen fixation protein NifZ